VRGARITAAGVPPLKVAISCVSNRHTQMRLGSSNAAIKMSLVGEKQSDERSPGGCGNCRVFSPSSTFHNSIAPSNFLPTARNRPSGENWMRPAPIASNSVLNFGVPFSTPHNLTRIEDPSSSIEAMRSCQRPWQMKTKPEPLVSNCSSPLSISQTTAPSSPSTKICVPLGLKQAPYPSDLSSNAPEIRCPVSESQI